MHWKVFMKTFQCIPCFSRSCVTAKASQVMSCIYVIEALGLNESQCSGPPQAVQWKVDLHTRATAIEWIMVQGNRKGPPHPAQPPLPLPYYGALSQRLVAVADFNPCYLVEHRSMIVGVIIR
jgi:hypothetical protein